MTDKEYQNKDKLPARRGYKRKFDEEKGWTYVPRSGFGTFFLTSFTSFLAILVVLNICMGTGYRGYKMAVTGLYGITETVGNAVSIVAQGLGFIINSNPYIGQIENFEGKNVYLAHAGQVVTVNGKKIIFVLGNYNNAGGLTSAQQRVVLYSEHDDFSFGDMVTTWWFFGWNIKNFRNDKSFGNVLVDSLNFEEYPFLEEYYT